MLPTSPEYFHVLLRHPAAGGVPVPIYPPARASQLEDHVLRHAGILANAPAVLLVTVDEAMVVGRLLQARVPGLRRLLSPPELMAAPAAACAGRGARRRHRLHPVHLGQHRQPQGRGADARQPAGQHPRHGRGDPASRATSSSAGCRCTTTWG
jgi:acyl-CoA synthetase (AMP-forming)/AMP-acid ligase II